MEDQPSAAESTPAKHWLTNHGSTLSDAAFVLLLQPTGIFNMRRKQAELFAVLTPSRQEPAASLRALLELSMLHMLSGSVFRDYREALDSH